MVLPQFAHDSQLCIVFWVNTFNYKWSPVQAKCELTTGIFARRAMGIRPVRASATRENT